MTARTLTIDQQLRHDAIRHRCQVAFGKSRRKRRIRRAMAARARLVLAVARGRRSR
jgi:hypothetical protein